MIPHLGARNQLRRTIDSVKNRLENARVPQKQTVESFLSICLTSVKDGQVAADEGLRGDV